MFGLSSLFCYNGPLWTIMDHNRVVLAIMEKSIFPDVRTQPYLFVLVCTHLYPSVLICAQLCLLASIHACSHPIYARSHLSTLVRICSYLFMPIYACLHPTMLVGTHPCLFMLCLCSLAPIHTCSHSSMLVYTQPHQEKWVSP